jgi:hypothetical protein
VSSSPLVAAVAVSAATAWFEWWGQDKKLCRHFHDHQMQAWQVRRKDLLEDGKAAPLAVACESPVLFLSAFLPAPIFLFFFLKKFFLPLSCSCSCSVSFFLPLALRQGVKLKNPI